MAQRQIVARGRSMIDDDSSDRVSQQSEEEPPSEGERPAVHPPVYRTIERLLSCECHCVPPTAESDDEDMIRYDRASTQSTTRDRLLGNLRGSQVVATGNTETWDPVGRIPSPFLVQTPFLSGRRAASPRNSIGAGQQLQDRPKGFLDETGDISDDDTSLPSANASGSAGEPYGTSKRPQASPFGFSALLRKDTKKPGRRKQATDPAACTPAMLMSTCHHD